MVLHSFSVNDDESSEQIYGKLCTADSETCDLDLLIGTGVEINPKI